ncbi:hypothetical protein BKA15_006597 [Microlunatus parietis]|uniref:Uncharacterized protein n=1 Tax=Microlunatus parietis TaxID=682979 RepID=A0A7Y9LFW4_9ACTN|nr:hypothetical protein [Microlunatus parietis]
MNGIAERRRADVDLESAGPSAAVAGAGVSAPARFVHAVRLWLARALS